MLDPSRDYTEADLAALEAEELARLASFELGDPVLVCRWRIAGRQLPLESRHLRALRARSAQGDPLTPEFCAWVQQHIEQTLDSGAAENPDGVLMIALDGQGRAAMALGPYEELEDLSAAGLTARAQAARLEAQETGVAPEILLAVTPEGTLEVGAGLEEPLAAVASLAVDVAKTLGVPVAFDPRLAARVETDPAAWADILLASDEHGVLRAADGLAASGEAAAANDIASRLEQGYRKLLDAVRAKPHRPF